MLFRALEIVRFLALLFALSLFFHTSSILAADGDMVWSFSEGNDPTNRGWMTARLGYGVPETDNAQADGVCEARSGTSVSTANLILGADVGKLEEGSSVNVRFTGGGFNYFVSGIVYGTKLQEGITGVSLDIDVKDPLWKALIEKSSLDYLVPGYSASKLTLKGGHDKFRQFVRACKSYAEALGDNKTADAKPDPKKVAETKKQPEKKAEYQTAAGPEKKASSSSGMPEKEAFDSAKELGTLEAWEAFLNNFPKGFRADLARAYVRRLGSEAPKPPAEVQKTLTPPPVVTAAPTSPPPSPADISLTQTANQASCKGGDNCSYTLIATNTGGTAFTGQLVIANSLVPRGATLISTGNAPWFCQGMGGGAVCTNPSANIAAGASTNLSLTFTLPRNAGGSVTSCSSISWGGAPSASGVIDVQQALNQRGFNVGSPDGQAGRKTVNAIRQFQTQKGLQASGEIDLPLLIALFTVPGAGDANADNDQACAGSAVFRASAPSTAFTPRPTAQYCADGRLRKHGKCVCPSGVPVWTGKTCVPRLTRNCTGGRYYNKSRKLCLCPSRKPHWYNNRCYAGVDDCPGDSVRVGNNCIKENEPAFETTRGGSGITCPFGTFRVGTNCVQNNLAPVLGIFGNTNRKKAKTPQTSTGSGPVTLVPQAAPPAPPIVKSQKICAAGERGNCKCSLGMVKDTVTPEVSPCRPACGGGKVRIFGVCCPPGSAVAQGICCPSGRSIGTGTSTRCAGSAAGRANVITGTRKVGCQLGFVLQGGKCVPKVTTGSKNTGIACVNGKVVNGRCQCPPNLPRFSRGKCKKADAKFILKQFTQPQNQPQTGQQQQQQQQQPQQNQQEQLQIPGLGGIIISDARLKRDIDLIATLESGLKLYAFRYLWDDALRIGVMAQDLLDDPVRREAVRFHESGFYMVDYGKLGLRMVTLEEWRAANP